MDNIKETNNYFYIGETFENKQAYIEYAINDDVLVIESTKVNASLRGQGIAATLVDYAVHYARQHNYSIKPVCSYALKQLKNNPEYQDVYKQSN